MRKVEIIHESPTEQRVRIRNEHSPLYVRLCQIAIPHMTGYQSDLCHDALTLAEAKVGDKYIWGYRDTGTTLLKIVSRSDPEELAQLALMSTKMETLHLLEITRKRGKECDGYATWIYCKDRDHLIRVIKDNINWRKRK